MDSFSIGRKEVRRAAALSVIAAVFLTTMKLVLGILTNSLGILSEALHSGLDLTAAGITFVAVTRASRAPDPDHLYGHGKAENFAALAETFLLWVTSAWIIYEAVRRMMFQEWPVPSPWGIVVMTISIIVDRERSQMLFRVARKNGSQALEADALHFSTDMLSSTVVLIGVLFVLTGVPIADPLAALGVSVVILFVSYRLGRRASDVLMDRAPQGIRDEISRRCSDIPGVIGCKRIRVRTAGPELFIDLVVAIDESVEIADAHLIAESLEKALAGLAHKVDVMVQVDPSEPTNMERPRENVYTHLQKLARAEPDIVSLHNVRIHVLSDRTNIDAHLEMTPDMTLEKAHEVSERFEALIREGVPRIDRVTLHLETTGVEDSAKDVTGQTKDIISSVKKIVEAQTPARDCHDITLREDEEGLVLSLDCRLNGDISLTDSHQVAEKVERVIKDAFPKITWVFVHVEPLSQG